MAEVNPVTLEDYMADYGITSVVALAIEAGIPPTVLEAFRLHDGKRDFVRIGRYIVANDVLGREIEEIVKAAVDDQERLL